MLEGNHFHASQDFLVSLPYQVHIVFADYCVVRCTVSRNLSIRTMTVADYTRLGSAELGVTGNPLALLGPLSPLGSSLNPATLLFFPNLETET